MGLGCAAAHGRYRMGLYIKDVRGDLIVEESRRIRQGVDLDARRLPMGLSRVNRPVRLDHRNLARRLRLRIPMLHAENPVEALRLDVRKTLR